MTGLAVAVVAMVDDAGARECRVRDVDGGRPRLVLVDQATL
jgi:hypothetical protein